MATTEPTFVGIVASVTGGVLRVRLRHDIPTTLLLVEGTSYRIGQIGGFFRLPIGYTQLYAVCTQVGADAAPPRNLGVEARIEDKAKDGDLSSYRWMTMVLFGEAIGARFERGVGQYPTVGDEVHFVTGGDLDVIYGRSELVGALQVGAVAASNAIPAKLTLNSLVSRHCAIVGSTGTGKSNLVSVMLSALSSNEFPSARVLVVDPHGEYGPVSKRPQDVFRITPAEGESKLVVPYWALPFDELLAITFGAMNASNETAIRDRVSEMKREAAKLLAVPPPAQSITADSPIPFSLQQLWFELDDYERQTFVTKDGNKVLAALLVQGNPATLTSNVYQPYQPGSREPIKQPAPRHLAKQLDLVRSRLTDPNYAFLFDPGDGLSPDISGKIQGDLGQLVAKWVGHESALTILDISELPSDVAVNVVGLLVRVVYDTLFWSRDLAISGRNQPLLVVMDEAHRFLPAIGEGQATSAHRIMGKIAKEGRKHGVGLVVVSQRPSELEGTILSQCGTMIALRITNEKDRSAVRGAFPDDLGGLVDLLPSLRTGEGLFVGEAMQIPTRVRIRRGVQSLIAGDPDVSERWRQPDRPSAALYDRAVEKWRKQSKG
jgi:DNA helicase HerA-like ATPase